MSTQQIITAQAPRSGCTLAELRQLVADTEHLPADSSVTARIGFGSGNRHGSRLTSLIVASPTEPPQ